MNRPFRNALTSTALAVLCLSAQAQQALPDNSLAAAAQKAITNNPEVTARFNALRAATNEIDVARGGFLPQVNLSADAGRTYDSIRGRGPEGQGLNKAGVALSINQVLWDGMTVRSEVDRLGHARLTRYFEFITASEDTALEATRAYIDVLRYRRLVELAEENYVEHRAAFDKLQSKAAGGVGSGVDAEQANARLALADSNLTTEVANLHDVTARYLRVVGDAPVTPLAPVRSALEKGVPADGNAALTQALVRSASVSAAVENLRSVESQAQGRESAFQPKVEARARTGFGKNLDGVAGQRRDTTGEVVLNWNLYNGGSDTARVRQFADLINQAADLRDKACRDVRQTVAVAHNDIRKIKDQLVALDRNVVSITKARNAYQQQFDAGKQRTLLDLLNSENELYTAKRAYANAEHDLQLAYARTQAAGNNLVSALGLSRPAEANVEEAATWQAGEEAAQRCPATSVMVTSTPRDELDARAKKRQVPFAQAEAAPEQPKQADPAAVASVQQRLRDWVATWMAKDVDKYMTFYAKEFAPARMSSAKWITERRRLVGKPGPIDIRVEGVKAEAKGEFVVTSFNQVYNSTDYKDATLKTLTWKFVNGQWIIFKESNR